MWDEMSRHMACKTCRDRKVRCDGGQPSCDRCLRSNDTCVYTRPANSTRVDMEQMLGSLQDRLARAEAQIHNPPADLAGYSTSMAGVNAPPMTTNDFTTTADLPPPFPAPSPWNTTFALNHPDLNALNNGPYSMSSDSDELMGSMNGNGNGNGAGPPTRNGHVQRSSSSADSPRSPPRNSSMPSLNELRAMNSQHDIDTSSDMTGSSECYSNGSGHDPMLQMLFSVFAVQADISGISSAVAEYLAWMMKTPYKAEDLAVLEILQARVSELNQMATTKHWSALKHVTAALGNGDPTKTQLRRMEAVLMEHNIKTMHFFHEKYDISMNLLEQKPE